MVDLASILSLMLGCFLGIILLLKILFFVRKQNEKVATLERRIKLMEEVDKTKKKEI